MRCLLCIFFFLIFAFTSVKAQQDTQFSYTEFNKLTQNPAFAGARNTWNVAGLFREQWTGIDGHPSIYAFNLDLPFDIIKSKHGVSFSFFSDAFGNDVKQKNSSIDINYAYKTNLFSGILSIGLKASFISQTFKGKSNLMMGTSWNYRKYLINEADGAIALDESNSIFDSALGVYFIKDNFQLGASVCHLLEPTFFSKNGLAIKNMRQMCMSFSYLYNVSSRLDIVSEINSVLDFDGMQSLLSCNSVFDDKYSFGLAYRQNDALIAQLAVAFKSGFKCVYSYDIGIDDFSSDSNGSHEIVIAYSFDINMKKQKFSSIRFL